jgi:zinc transport system substrate-binding protein
MRIILIMLGAVALTGCGRAKRADVVAGFYPLAFAAQQIGGPDVSVRNLTPPGAEPHDLEVAPSDVQSLRSARLVLLLGHGFQPQLERAAGTSDHVDLLLDTPGLRLIPGDPHVWLDPLGYASLARRIGAALDRPKRAAAFVDRLRSLDREYRRGLAHCVRRDIVTSHAAFAYLARRYGLHQIAVTGVTPEAEPTPHQLENVVTAVRRTHASTVFTEPLVSPRVADTVARETGAATAVLDPLEGLTPAEQRNGQSYFSLMRKNLATLRRALGCR